MYLKKGHPWNPGYAIPKTVLSEGRYAKVTRGPRSGTGRGPAAVVTAQAPRGTIGQSIPNVLTSFGSLGSTGLGSLGSLVGDLLVGSEADPVANFGREGAQFVIAKIRTLPPADRPAAMRAVLMKVNPALIARVEARAEALKKRGYDATTALEKALAGNLADEMLSNFRKYGNAGTALGCSGNCGSCGRGSDDGLGALVYQDGRWVEAGTAAATTNQYAPPPAPSTSYGTKSGLPPTEDKIYLVALVGATGSAVRTGRSPYKTKDGWYYFYNMDTKQYKVARVQSDGILATVGSNIGKAAEAAYDGLKAGACAVASLKTTAAVVGVVGGGAASAGVAAASSACSSGGGAAPYVETPPPASSGGGMSLPIILGAAGLAAILLLKR